MSSLEKRTILLVVGIILTGFALWLLLPSVQPRGTVSVSESGLNEQKPPSAAEQWINEQKILFEVRYTNTAWGFDLQGVMSIYSNGDVIVQETDSGQTVTTTYSDQVKRDILLTMVEKVLAITAWGKSEERRICYDMATYKYTTFYASSPGNIRFVTFYQTGEFGFFSLADAIPDLVAWLREVGKQVGFFSEDLGICDPE